MEKLQEQMGFSWIIRIIMSKINFNSGTILSGALTMSVGMHMQKKLKKHNYSSSNW